VKSTAFKGRGRCCATSAQRERGTILIETMIAAALLLTVTAGLMNAFLVVVAQNQAQGNIATRTTEYAQDKMEQLVTLNFTDAGLGGAMAASSTVGSIPPAVAVTNYVDYLDQNGNTVTSATAEYTRQWTIATDSTGTLKTITVVVSGQVSKGLIGVAPSTTLVCMKSSGL
jgi:Flp pilus assembly protein TadG